MPRKFISDEVILARDIPNLKLLRVIGRRKGKVMVEFMCHCGKVATADLGSITPRAKPGHYQKGCGCGQRIHGGYKTPEHTSWEDMRYRCENPNRSNWKNYGGRGITFCERWSEFKNFIEDMGRMPGPGYTIERIDNNGNYEPGNCKWATRVEQQNNRRTNRVLEFNGERLTYAQWARRTGLRSKAISWRVGHGWPIEEILTMPKVMNKGRGGRHG